MSSTTEGERTLQQMVMRWHDYRVRTPLHKIGSYLDEPIPVVADFINFVFVGNPDALHNTMRREKKLQQLGTLATRTWYHRWRGRF